MNVIVDDSDVASGLGDNVECKDWELGSVVNCPELKCGRKFDERAEGLVSFIKEPHKGF